VATIASNALPPFRNIDIPISEASSRAETTIAFSVTNPVGDAGARLHCKLEIKSKNIAAIKRGLRKRLTPEIDVLIMYF
jgi:hypothetical protein